MSIASPSIGERPIGDQKRAIGTAKVPPLRLMVAKPDAKLTPEPR